MSERAVRVSITGLVQGVGYRAWLEREAQTRGLSGWVRNRRDGSVEAVFAGDPAIVEAMLAACRRGPSVAQVDDVAITETSEPMGRGFQVLPTA
jgi:acylphosphatase